MQVQISQIKKLEISKVLHNACLIMGQLFTTVLKVIISSMYSLNAH